MKDMLPTLAIIAAAACALLVLVVLGPGVRMRVADDLPAQTVTSVRVLEDNSTSRPVVSADSIADTSDEAAPEPFVNVPETAREAIKEIAQLTESTDEE